MTFDFKKEEKQFYNSGKKPVIVEIPEMNFLSVRGKGNPNEENGEYKKALELIYAIAYTLKMSYKSDYKIEGFFNYVVPPLEGLWCSEKEQENSKLEKGKLSWISLIRLPDFIKKEDFEWAIKVATDKKKKDFSKVEFFTYKEGICVQCVHIGSYDDEPKTISSMEEYARKKGYIFNITEKTPHHEIYLSDPRKVDVSKMKTIIRYPIKKLK